MFDQDYTIERELVESCIEVGNTLKYAYTHGQRNFWMEDVLDVEYIVTSDGICRDVKVYFGLGGPTIWVDISAEEVQGSWGCARSREVLTSCVVDWIRDLYAEEFDAMMVHR